MHKKTSLILSLLLIIVLGLLPMVSTAQTVPTPDDDTLVVVQNAEPGALDPSEFGGTGGLNFRILMHMFATLFELGQADGAIDPYLAHSFTISEDGTEWDLPHARRFDLPRWRAAHCRRCGLQLQPHGRSRTRLHWQTQPAS